VGKTFKHKLKGKYSSKVLDYFEDPAPIDLQKFWDRDNWNWGKARLDKKAKRIKDLDKDLKDDLCIHQEI